MNPIINKLGKKITGELKVPGDKSISIRAAIISSLFYGDYEFLNFNYCDDTKACVSALYKISKFSKDKSKTLTIDCKNSATTMRLLAGYIVGAFSGIDKKVILKGDKSLSKRPMNRIVLPLKKMGAYIKSTGGYAPLTIDLSKCKLHNLSYKSDIASAQVKSCLLLASYASGVKLIYKEPCESRNHTELMLSYMEKLSHHKCNCHNEKCTCHEYTYKIPADISTSAFFITNAIIYHGSNIKIKNVLMNKTRTGFLDTLKKMGIKITYSNKKLMQNEPTATLSYKNSKTINIKPVTIYKNEVPRMIDEIPLIALLLAKACGVSKIYGLSELKVKESDRIKGIEEIFKVLSIRYKISNDNLTIYGNKNLDYKILGNKKYLSVSKDHRMLMIAKILNIKIKNKKYLSVAI